MSGFIIIVSKKRSRPEAINAPVRVLPKKWPDFQRAMKHAERMIKWYDEVAGKLTRRK